MRIVLSSGKSSRRRREICSGLQALAQRRLCRCTARRPFHTTFGPTRDIPSGVAIIPGKPVLHIIAQDRIDRQLRRLWPSGGPVSVPLCRGRTVFRSTVAARHIATEFTRDRGWSAIELTSDGSYTTTPRAQDGDLFTFGERKVAP